MFLKIVLKPISLRHLLIFLKKKKKIENLKTLVLKLLLKPFHRKIIK